MLNQKVIRGWHMLRVIISIILETSSHAEIQNKQYSKTVETIETVLSILSILVFMYAIYWTMIVGCALSDQCYNDWAGI